MSFVHLIQSDINNKLEINDVGIIEKEINDCYFLKILRTSSLVKVLKSHTRRFNIESTGDEFDFKVCDRCFKILPTEYFSNNRHKKDNLITKRPSCKSCRKLKDGTAIPLQVRYRWEQKRPPNYSTFTCPICNKTTIVSISSVVLDHNHKDGRVRGWLCESCNTGIGRFDDDEKIVQRAIDWLKKEH